MTRSVLLTPSADRASCTDCSVAVSSALVAMWRGGDKCQREYRMLQTSLIHAFHFDQGKVACEGTEKDSLGMDSRGKNRRGKHWRGEESKAEQGKEKRYLHRVKQLVDLSADISQ